MNTRQETQMLAYARLGKGKKLAGKSNEPHQLFSNRTKPETGIYEAIIDQLEPGHNHYIRELIGRNSSLHKRQDPSPTKNKTQHIHMHDRAKSSADIHEHIDSEGKKLKMSRDIERGQHTAKLSAREERKTHKIVSPTSSNSSFQGSATINKKHAQNMHLYENPSQIDQPSFLQSLDTYIWSISRCRHAVRPQREERLLMPLEENSLVRELKAVNQQLSIENQQLRIRNRGMKAQKKRWNRKEQMVKEKIIEMMREIKYLRRTLEDERRERGRLEEMFGEFERNIRKWRPRRREEGELGVQGWAGGQSGVDQSLINCLFNSNGRDSEQNY